MLQFLKDLGCDGIKINQQGYPYLLLASQGQTLQG